MKKITLIIVLFMGIISFSKDFDYYKEFNLNDNDKNLKVEMVVSDINFKYSFRNNIEVYYKNSLNEFPNINFNKYVNNTTISEDFIDTYKTFSLFKRLALGKNTYVKNWNGNGEYDFLVGYNLNELILINNKGDITLDNITINDSLRVINSLGNTYLKNISSNDIFIENKMGKININNIFVQNETYIKNDSGNITISNHDNLINNLNIESNSSLISLQEIVGNKININNGKGRIDLIIKKIKNLNINMQEGNIYIKLYGDKFNLDLKTKEGKVRVFGDEEESDYKYNNKTYSNNIRVELKKGNIYVYDVSFLN